MITNQIINAIIYYNAILAGTDDKTDDTFENIREQSEETGKHKNSGQMSSIDEKNLDIKGAVVYDNFRDGDRKVEYISEDSLYEVIDEENHIKRNEICDTSLYDNIETNGNGSVENDISEDNAYDVIDGNVINVYQQIIGGNDRVGKV